MCVQYKLVCVCVCVCAYTYIEVCLYMGGQELGVNACMHTYVHQKRLCGLGMGGFCDPLSVKLGVLWCRVGGW